MSELIISREFLLASYYDARNTLGHDEAVAQVAGTCGQTVETVQQVIDEEAATA